MRILILSVSDKRHMSMVAPYEEYLKKNNIKYDVIRINRYIETKEIIYTKNELSEIYEFPFVQSTNKSKIFKIIPFIRFRNYAKKIIESKKYDFVIVWNENTALLFGDILLKHKKEYCLNYRDILEIPFTKKIQKKLIENAYFNTSPSPADAFGNKEKFITLYNRDLNILQNVKKKSQLKKKGETLNIVFMGLYGSAPKTFQKTVDLLGNDNRYRLFFYGDGFDTHLKEYVKQNKIKNVITGGAFKYENTFLYLEEADIINSYYNNFDINPNLKFVSGVKQSYTPMLYIPAINDDNTTWADISKQYGFSYLINKDNLQNIADELQEWYFNLDFSQFKEGCDRFNRIVEESQKVIFDLLDAKLLDNRN